MRPVRWFPFGHASTTPNVETAPLPERLTLPLDESAPRRAALPFIPTLMLPPPIIREMPRVVDVRAPSRAQRWRRLAVVMVALLIYVAALLAMAAPPSWWP